MIKVLVNGAKGKMGTVACQMIEANPLFSLVARGDKNDDLRELIRSCNCDIVLELTNADVVYKNTKIIIEENIRPVIGASGLLQNQIDEFKYICKNKSLGGLIIPNFSISAVLMIKFSKMAAKYFNNIEIIEQHHNNKKDYPSGTAIYTANEINNNIKKNRDSETAIIEGARGAVVNNINIHSIRTPGVVAKQETIFGSSGETLTIKQESIDRECFMAGLKLCLEEVVNIDRLILGMEDLL